MLSTIVHRRRACGREHPTALLGLLYGLFLVCGIAQSAIVPLLPHLSQRYGLTESETALLLALPGVATLAVSVPAGLAADRYGARRVTLAAGALLALACVAQAGQTLALLLAGRVAFGVAFGVVWTSGLAWLAEIDRGPAGARLGPSVTCSSVGVMLGPAVGGILGQGAGTGLPFLLIALVAAAVVVPLTLGSSPPEPPEPPAGTPRPADGARLRTPGARRSVRAMLALARLPGFTAAAGGLMVVGAVSGTSQLLITGGLHDDGVSEARIGLAFSAAAVCYIAVSAAILRVGERARTLRFNALATSLLALALLPAMLSGGTPALVGALLLCAVPRAAVSTISYSLASTAAGGHRDGAVIGMLNGAWAGAMVLTPLMAGALEQHGGAPIAFLAVIVPSMLIGIALVAGCRPRASNPAGRERVDRQFARS